VARLPPSIQLFAALRHLSRIRLNRTAVFKRVARMTGRHEPKDAGRARAQSMEDAVHDLQATSRMVTAELCRLGQQVKRASDRRASPVSRYRQLVLKAIARQTSAPMPAWLIYLVQRCHLGPDGAGDQLRVADIESFVNGHVRAAALPCIDPDGSVGQRTRIGNSAWRAAATHLADLELAQWAAGCNTQQRAAPTTAQVHTKWSSLKRSRGCHKESEGHTGSEHRRRRRSLQRWRQRWGFRYGKMKLRDHFADGELLRKASCSFFFPPPPPKKVRIRSCFAARQKVAFPAPPSFAKQAPAQKQNL
jgi:hypothetical protein